MNIYEETTNRILQQLDAGVIPWRKTWATGLPKSFSTQKEYRGVNILVMGTTTFTSRYWVTYREAERWGGHIRRGERATPVIYWKWRTKEELDRRRQETGKEVAPCVPFTNAVFNLDQTEGLQRPSDDFGQQNHARLDLAEQVWSAMPERPEIVHQQVGGPCYQPAVDRIILPNLSQFESAEQYYGTLYHELTHATGHPKRLNRLTAAEGDRRERYGFEELVAEFGASFLCASAGISHGPSQELEASYIAEWAKVFRQDKQLIVRAASAAQRGVDYIHGHAGESKIEPGNAVAVRVSVQEQAHLLQNQARTSHGAKARRPELSPWPRPLASSATHSRTNRVGR